MVNGIASLISLSDFSLLEYRNVINFCVLIFYPIILPSSWMSPSRFLIACLGFSMCSIMSSANSDSLTSWIKSQILFISFSSLIAMTRTSKIILNSSGENGHPCFVPDFRGNVFSFSPLRMFAVGLPYTAFMSISSKSILKEIHHEYSLEGLILKLNLQLVLWWKELTCWKRPWWWERLKAGGEGDGTGWHDCMASLSQWT